MRESCFYLIFPLLWIIMVARNIQKYRRLTLEDYPDVDPEKFLEWKQADIGARKTSLCVSCYVFLVILLTEILTGVPFSRHNRFLGMILMIVLIVGLIIGFVREMKARKLGLVAGVIKPSPQLETNPEDF